MESINLNLIPTGANPVVHVSQYDTGRVIRFNIFEGSSVYFLDGTETIACNIKKPDNNIVTLSVTNTTDSYVEITTTEQATACDGLNLCEISITKGDDVIGSLNFIMEVERSPIEGGIESESEINNLWTQVDGMVADALATQYDSANVVFDNLPTEGHGIPYTVTSEGIGNAIDNALDMTDTARGAIATFESEYALPLRDLEIEINAVQESGTPTSSSPKAISGFTGANIKVAGKNLINITDCLNDYYVKSSDMSVSSIAGANVFYCDVPKNTDLVLTPDKSNRCVILGYKTRPSTIAGSIGDELIVDSPAGITSRSFNTGNNQFLAIYVNRDSANKPTQIMLEVGTVASAYQAYNSTTTAISWQDEAGTVYGGSLDVTSGLLTVTWHAIDLGSLTWTYDAGSVPSNPYFFCQRDTVKVSTQNLLCSIYQLVNVGVSSMPNYSMKSNNKGQVLIVNHDYSDENTFKTAMSGVLLVCEKLTPVTYQLTPTQISAIVGTNNVFADTNGDTSLEYYTKRGEQTVRIAEGVAVDVINNKSIDTLNTTDKTVKGAINELETKKANGWAFVNETLGNTDINLPTGWSEILVVCRYGNGGVLQPQAVSIVITPEQKGLYMTAGASTILAQVVVSADATKINMAYFGVSGTEYTSDSQIRVWYR